MFINSSTKNSCIWPFSIHVWYEAASLKVWRGHVHIIDHLVSCLWIVDKRDHLLQHCRIVVKLRHIEYQPIHKLEVAAIMGTGISYNDPGDSFFYQICFHQFQWLYLLLRSFLICFQWSPVQPPCKTGTSHTQCADLLGGLELLETALFALCHTSKALFLVTWVYF